MAKNINKTPFDEATKLKLDIFGECFEEWLPVFNSNPFIDKVYIFDFFAGSGLDIKGNPGSPLILLDKAKGDKRKYCSKAQKEIKFFFNENQKKKSKELQQNVDEFIAKCAHTNTCSDCVYTYTVENYDFQDIISNTSVLDILNNKKIGKFILLDQYGFSQINEDIFQLLISSPKTDFIFFISSSFINRFKDHPYTLKHIDTSKIAFEDRKPSEIHRAVADYFRDLIPDEKEYYLHHFSIRKEEKKGNYYGLIFGTNHSLGMEKFLKVCWNHDKFSGEANYNIDGNYEKGSLFYDRDRNVKKEIVKELLKEKILSGEINNNINGFKYTMHQGCLPILFTDIVNELVKDGKIERDGELNYSSTNIHKVKEYKIRRVRNDA